jgi:hypothetical protein
MKRSKENEYEVGYGKPPKHSQFKPGQSGNRNGRRKHIDTRTTFERLLQTEVTITTNGKKRKVPFEEALIMNAMSKAMAGDKVMMRLLMQMMEKRGRLEQDEQTFVGLFVGGTDLLA